MNISLGHCDLVDDLNIISASVDSSTEWELCYFYNVLATLEGYKGQVEIVHESDKNLCKKSIDYGEAFVYPIQMKFSGLIDKLLDNHLNLSLAPLLPLQQLHMFEGLIFLYKMVNSIYIIILHDTSPVVWTTCTPASLHLAHWT